MMKLSPISVAAAFVAVLFGLITAVFGGLVSIALALILILVGLTLRDFRVGLVVLMILIPFQNTVWLPSFTGFNLINYFTAATLGSLLLKRFFQGIPLVKVPASLLWLYLLPIILATALGVLSVDRVPLHFLAIVESYMTKRKYVMDLAVRPLLTILTAWMLGTAVLNSKAPERFLVSIVLGPILMAVPSIVFLAMTGFSLDFLSSSSVSARMLLDQIGLHPNDLGPLLATGLILQLFLLPHIDRGLTRILLLAATAIVACGLLLTFSRGGYLVAVVGVGYFIFTRRKLHHLAILLIGVAVLGAIFGGAFMDRVTTGVSGGFGGAIGSARPDELTAGRVMIWRYLWPDALGSPIWGSGLGSIAWSWAVTSGLVVVGHPHNLYLRIFMDMGALGLGAILAFYWWVFRHFRRMAKSKGLPPVVNAAFDGISAAFIGFLVNGLSNGNYVSVEAQVCIWMMFGLGLGYATRLATESTVETTPAPAMRRGRIGFPVPPGKSRP